MPETAASPELLRSLGHLVRGLSALFWGLPLALIIGTGTASVGWFQGFGLFGFMPAMVVAGMLFFGLWEIGSFQRQERPWRNALDRARLLALVGLGLTPFLSWSHRLPGSLFFSAAVGVLQIVAVLLLFSLNSVLQRLAAMLPDEALRHETRNATSLNRLLLAALLALQVAFVLISRLPLFSDQVALLHSRILLPALGLEISSVGLLFAALCVLLLLPLSMTMALIWKTKEVIMDSVFSGGR